MSHRYAIVPIRLDISRGDTCEIDLPDPAIVRGVHVIHAPRSQVLLRDKPEIESFPAMFVEIDPEGTVHKRRYVLFIAQPQNVVQSPEPLTCCGVVSINGAAIAIYEAPARDIAPKESNELAPVVGEIEVKPANDDAPINGTVLG